MITEVVMNKAFNVRLPSELITRVREYSVSSGIKIWRIVADALEKYLKGVKR
jgi:predicted DNA binding CopG/RHH family protein